MVKPKRYTQVSYRNGRPIAAYVYLSGWPGHKSARTELVDGGLVVDYSETNEPLGLEIVNPESVSIETVDEVLRRIGEEPLKSTEVEALRRPQQIRSTLGDQACQAIRTAMAGLKVYPFPGH